MNVGIWESSEGRQRPNLRALFEKMGIQRRSCEEAALKFLPDNEIEHLLVGESSPISGS